MAKNVLIFSDGTGQAGGLTPDQEITNVYKLYRATRCGPDNSVDPNQQLAFYDPGLGSRADGFGLKFGWGRWLYNVASRATGLGISRNIEDCYAALIRLWEPGDRIYLVGFSRGAYTVRCLGGVLARCGIPTRMSDGSPLRRDPKSAAAIAKRAVRGVYQHQQQDRSDAANDERARRAEKFRQEFASSGATGGGNADPYFIGVFDTVGAIANRSFFTVAGAFAAVTLLTAVVAARLPDGGFETFSKIVSGAAFIGFAITVMLGLITRFAADDDAWRKRLSNIPWLTPFTFYDMNLNARVRFARHAISIDENRRDFPPAAWAHDPKEGPQGENEPDRIVQLWFSGVHSDIGGSYAENESRLSDTALQWMADEMAALPAPVHIDRPKLAAFPSPAGMQHDEIKSSGGLIGWQRGPRPLNDSDRLHPSVKKRFEAGPVLHYDVAQDYRPEGLRSHPEVAQFYA